MTNSMNPYIPNELPVENLDYKKLFPLVGKANAQLARYDGLLQGIPNPEVMLSPLTIQEAVLSSKIEGTQATMDEVLQHEAGILKQGEQKNDIQEIINYRHALLISTEHLKEYPIKLSFIRQLHKVLLDSVRGQDKTPGDFRRDQNWIGPEGCKIEEATFIPPSPLILNDFLEKWLAYIDYDDMDFLLQTAILHAQFELIHPFKDGNGRIGRILIPLFLYQKKVLSQPMFYLSEYLEKNREEYYQKLVGISRDGNWNDWIEFFLKAIEYQASKNAIRVKSIMSLYDQSKINIHKITRSQYSVYLLDAIFNKPIFNISDLAKRLNEKCNIHKKTAQYLIHQLKHAGMLIELMPASGRKSATLCFVELISTAEGKLSDT